MKAHWFEWKGKRSDAMGLAVLELPPIIFAEQRVDSVEIPGRHGTLNMPQNALNEITLTATCMLLENADIAALGAWLQGNGRLTFSHRQGGHYDAWISNQIKIDRMVRKGSTLTFAVNFRCYPLFYLAGNTPITINQSGTAAGFMGSAEAMPKIEITGKGDITLLVGAQTVKLSMGSGGTWVLDTALEECYNSGSLVSRNSGMTGEFPRLTDGVNMVSWTGNVSKIIITPNWVER